MIKNKTIFFIDFDGTIIPFLKFKSFKNIREFKNKMMTIPIIKKYREFDNHIKHFRNKEKIILTAKGKYDCYPAYYNLNFNKIKYDKFIYCGGLQFNRYTGDLNIVAKMKVKEILKYIENNNINIKNVYYVDSDKTLLDKMFEVNSKIKYIKL